MIKQDALTRIFWPLDAVKPGVSGVLVGWRNSSSDYFLVSVLENAEYPSVERALRSDLFLRGSRYPIQRIWDRCGRRPLEIIGLLNPEKSATSSAEKPYLIILMNTESPWPRVGHSVHETGDVQLIFFERPHPVQMQFVSLEPISLALTHESDIFGLQELRLAELDASENAETARVQNIVRKLRQHTVVKFAPSDKESMLRVIINQVNCCFEINSLVQKNMGFALKRAQRSLSVSDRVSDSAKDLWTYGYTYIAQPAIDHAYPIARKAVILMLMIFRVAAEVILKTIQAKIQPHGAALRDVSATALQVDLRLQQFCYWPIQYQALRKRRRNWRSITNHHTEYIRFFNSLWLVANDVIIGMAVGSFLVHNSDVLAQLLEHLVDTWSTAGFHQSISWLTRNPGGLKLNNELAQFLGSLFGWIIDYWAGSVQILKPLFPGAIRLMGLASVCGATMPVSICSDILSLFTLHAHCFYLASARIYHLQLTTIISLFHLFRGKKRNVLRNRIDSCDYELDQLLLGTVMFTLLTFLLPTVLVFYSTFAFVRTIIILLKAMLDIMLAALNHFPLFALMLRVKDSKRLPGGLRFELHPRAPNPSDPPPAAHFVAHIFLKPIPLSVRAILQEYFRFGSRIRRHYFSGDVLFRVATGRIVPPLPRRNLYGLQYSMLPAQRVGIRALWDSMHESDEDVSEEREDDAARDSSHSHASARKMNGGTL